MWMLKFPLNFLNEKGAKDSGNYFLMQENSCNLKSADEIILEKKIQISFFSSISF